MGVGAGWLKSEYAMTGIPFDPPGVRVARLEEAERVVKGLAADDLLASPHALIGTPAQIADDLRQRRDEYGISCIVINTGVEAHIGAFAPVVALLGWAVIIAWRSRASRTARPAAASPPPTKRGSPCAAPWGAVHPPRIRP